MLHKKMMMAVVLALSSIVGFGLCAAATETEVSVAEQLEDAIKFWMDDKVQQLAKSGFDTSVFEFRDTHNRTLLHLAATAQSSTLKILLAHGFTKLLEEKDTSGCTVLFTAVESIFETEAKVQMLIEAGARADTVDTHGRTLLLVASEKGKVNNVRLLLEAGAPINVVHDGWGTALSAAVESGHAEIVDYLLSVGADPLLKRKYGQTPLEKAISKGYAEVVRLLEPAVEKAMKKKKEELLAAVRSHDCAQLQAAFDSGVDVNTQDGQGNTLLHHAAVAGGREVIELLLRRGADYTVTNNAGQTPIQVARTRGDEGAEARRCMTDHAIEKLIFAATYGGAERLETAHKIIVRGVDQDILAWRSQDGQSLLHCAVGAGRTELLKLFLTNGFSEILEAKDSHGYTALALWVFCDNNDEVAQALIDAGADLNARDTSGTSILNIAVGVSTNSDNKVRILLNAPGIEVSAADEFGDTALRRAIQEGKHNIVQRLIEAGATPLIKKNSWDSAVVSAAEFAKEKGKAEIATWLQKNTPASGNVGSASGTNVSVVQETATGELAAHTPMSEPQETDATGESTELLRLSDIYIAPEQERHESFVLKSGSQEQRLDFSQVALPEREQEFDIVVHSKKSPKQTSREMIMPKKDQGHVTDAEVESVSHELGQEIEEDHSRVPVTQQEQETVQSVVRPQEFIFQEAGSVSPLPKQFEQRVQESGIQEQEPYLTEVIQPWLGEAEHGSDNVVQKNDEDESALLTLSAARHATLLAACIALAIKNYTKFISIKKSIAAEMIQSRAEQQLSDAELTKHALHALWKKHKILVSSGLAVTAAGVADLLHSAAAA